MLALLTILVAGSTTVLVDPNTLSTPGALVALIVAITGLVSAITALIKVHQHDPVIQDVKQALNGGSGASLHAPSATPTPIDRSDPRP